MKYRSAIHLQATQHLTEDFIRVTKEVGFDGVAFGYMAAKNGGLLKQDNWREEIQKICRWLEKYDLPCVQTHLPCYAIRRPSDEANEEEAQLIERGIEATAILGAKWGAWHPRTDFNHNFDRENGFRDNVRELTRFVKTAEQFGVGIAVENLPVFPTDKEVLFFTSHYEDLIRVVDAMDSPYVGICWDTGHANLMPFQQGDALRAVGNRLKILHLDNNLGFEDLHNSLAIGTIPWDEVVSALLETGYDGFLTHEVYCPFNFPELVPTFLRHHGECAQWFKQFFPQV